MTHKARHPQTRPFLAAAVGMPIGFAGLNGGTTGGGNATTVTVSTAAAFRTYATSATPYNIKVQGTLDVGAVKVASNKTILGLGSTGGFIGSLQLTGVSNVIVQNLALSNPNAVGEGDAMTLRRSTNVWVDHCNFSDSPDGLFDVVEQSDFVTGSWNKFSYTAAYAANVNTNHRFTMLIGNGDDVVADAGKLHVTLYDNWWTDRADQRMPRVRYGQVHVFNNFYNPTGNDYNIAAGFQSQLLVENNSFENTEDAYQKMDATGLIKAIGNQFVGVINNQIDDGNDAVFTPPYAYTLASATTVKPTVIAGAGVGVVPEPTAVVLVGLAAAGVLTRRRRV